MTLSENEIKLAIQGMWNAANKVAEQIDVSDKKYNKLQSQFDFLDNAISRKNDDIKKLEEIIKGNIDTIKHRDVKIASQYSDIEKLQAQQTNFFELEANYMKSINENSSLKFELENIGKNNLELETLKKEHSELLSKCKQAKIDFDNTLDKIKILEREQKDLEIAKKELINSRYEIINRNEKIDKLKIALSEQQSISINLSKKIKQVEETNKINMNELEKLRDEINTLREKNIVLEQEIEQVSITKDNEILNYIAKYENIKNEINYYDEVKIKNDNIIKELEIQLLEKDSNLLNQLEKYRNTVNALKDENEKNIKYNEKIKEEYEEGTEKLASEVNNLMNKLVSATILNQEYEERINELQQRLLSAGSIEFIEPKYNEIGELIAENERLTDIITQLKEELDSNKAGFKHLTTENERLQNEIAGKKYTQKLEKLSKLIKELEKSNKEYETTIKKLHNELKSYKKRIYDENSLFADAHTLEISNEIDNYKQQITKLTIENQGLKNKLNQNNIKPTLQKDEIVNKINNLLTKLENKI
jgi:chromosome segregation ATPase